LVQLAKRSTAASLRLTSAVKVVAAIPCFNTQHTIGDVVTKTRKYVDEVIVIDDGSTDLTAYVAEVAGATVIKHGKNKGYGEAIKSCFSAGKAAEADILVIIDGDGQHNPDEIPRLIMPVINTEADLTVGSRFLNNGHEVPRYRRFGIELINSLWNFGSELKVSDTQSGFRAYGKNVIQDMNFSEKGMSISIDILENARRNKNSIVEVPISCSYENNNSSLSLKAIQHGIFVALAVLKIRLKNRVSF
jgi:glycosyltransferase involved in cell wall biosynthesis